MNVLTVLEHQRLDDTQVVRGQLTAQDYQWLLEQTTQGHLPCFKCGIYQGKAVLVVRHYLAVLLLPSGRYLEILPKVSQVDQPSDLRSSRQGVRALIKALLPQLFTLTPTVMTAAAPASSTDLASLNMTLDAACEWLNVLLELWQKQLTNLPTMLPRTYVTYQQNHPQAHGKLQLNAQIRHNAHRPHFRYTSQAKLTWHVAWYGLFFGALQQVRRLGICPKPSSYQAVNALRTGHPINGFGNGSGNGSGVQSMSAERYPRAFYYRLLASANQPHGRVAHDERHFQQRFVIDMACWLLNLPQNDTPTHALPNFGLADLYHDHDIHTPAHAPSHTPALMFNMPRLFEAWVGHWLKQRLPNCLYAQQTAMWLTDDKGEQKFIRPDLQILPTDALPLPSVSESAELTTLATLGLTSTSHVVIDIKYKVPNALSQVLASDLYQIYSYQKLLKADAAWLIYPANAFLQQPKRLQLHDGGYIDLLGFDMMTGELLI